jgi:hypothetical protein
MSGVRAPTAADYAGVEGSDLSGLHYAQVMFADRAADPQAPFPRREARHAGALRRAS